MSVLSQLKDFFFGEEVGRNKDQLEHLKFNDEEVYVLRFAGGQGNRYNKADGGAIELIPANQLAADRITVLKSQGSSKTRYVTQKNIPKVLAKDKIDSCLAPSSEVASDMLDTLDETFNYATVGNSVVGLVKPTVRGVVVEDFFDEVEEAPPAAKKRRMGLTIGSDAFVAGVEVGITHSLKI